MIYLLRVGLFALIFSLPLALRAQQLDATDTAEIQKKAIRHVRQFEGLLNVISQSDEYFRKYDFDQLIRNYYTDASNYQIFRDSLVVVVDDLNPKQEAPEYENLLTIKNYLKTFFSLYAKSPPPSVVFDNYEVSAVRQGDFTYVEIFYDSKFRNRHRAFPDLAYPVRRRKVTVKAEPAPGGWRVVITDVSYASPTIPTDAAAPTAKVASSTVPVAVTSAPIPANEAKVLPTASTPTKEPEIDSIASSEPQATPAVAELPVDNAFTDTRGTYRKGKKYRLPLQINPTAPPSSLMLYQGSELIDDLSRTLDADLRWQVPRKMAEGNNYQFRFYDPATEEVVESPTFEIKRKARWPLVAGAVGVAAVVYLVVSNGDDGGGGEEDNLLPAPPSPK